LSQLPNSFLELKTEQALSNPFAVKIFLVLKVKHMKIKPLKLIHLVACLFMLASTSKAYAVNNCIIGDAVTDCSLLGADITAVTTGVVNNGLIIGDNILNAWWAGITHSGDGANAVAASGITNNGTVTGWVNGIGVYDSANIAGGIINNSGALISGFKGIQTTPLATISSINNAGSIVGFNLNSNASAADVFAGIENAGVISEIINTGSIYSSRNLNVSFGIVNTGIITTLNNLQGAGNTNGALTYTGALPTNYNIIINSPTSFGRLAVTSGTGTTTFGIYSGSTVRNGTYSSVLSGLTLGNLTSTSGTFGSGSWILNNSSADIWDLILSGYIDAVVLTGPSVANTNQSLVNTSSALQGTYTLQNSVLANSFSYDCNIFGANNVCVSAGGRNTTVQAANGLNNTSALLIAAYRPHPNYRIGAYADQNLSVSNPGGTVNLGNNTPLIGLFGAWTQRLNGTGAEVKVSAAYGQKNTTITRSVVGSGATASEAGTGSSTLNSQGAQITAKYGFGVVEDLIVSPYVGVRYTQNNMGGYTEATSSSVTAPLTYSALNTNATTALAGVGASYKVIPAVTTFASAGVETDTNTSNGTYSATNASIGTLTPVNFNANPVRTRPTATLGAYYDVAKNQRLGVTGIYRQEAYQAVQTTTVLATYTIGL
jgi:hypothetical protein